MTKKSEKEFANVSTAVERREYNLCNDGMIFLIHWIPVKTEKTPLGISVENVYSIRENVTGQDGCKQEFSRNVTFHLHREKS